VRRNSVPGRQPEERRAEILNLRRRSLLASRNATRLATTWADKEK
jgi:hypothetical protein